MGPLTIKAAKRTEKVAYAVRDVIVLAEEVARQGKEMLYLNIGDPCKFGFKTPRHIIEATYRALRANRNGYAPSSGIEEAREAIEAESRRKGIGNIQDIFVTTGATEAIDICFTALANAGENVLVPCPGYPTYDAILHKLGVEPRAYYLDEANNWRPDMEDIKGKVDGKTRAIVLISPNNPTGALYPDETVRAIVQLAGERNLVIFSDEIYDKLILEGQKHISPASLDNDVPVVTLNGLSKNYVVPGFRIGWGVISGREAILQDFIGAVNKLLRARLCANHPEQWAIKPALEGDQSHLVRMQAKLTHRRDVLMKMLNSVPGISCVRPEGGFYAFPRLDIKKSDQDFVRELVKETGVVVVPGSGFGQPPGTKHFRVVFLPPEDMLIKACTKIGSFFHKFSRA